jgi:hypothetical protein
MATHVRRMTYFVKNLVRDMVSITTSAIYVKGFVQFNPWLITQSGEDPNNPG